MKVHAALVPIQLVVGLTHNVYSSELTRGLTAGRKVSLDELDGST